jgi:hypothetical protein
LDAYRISALRSGVITTSTGTPRATGCASIAIPQSDNQL